jgi:hypothetical protein
MSEEKKLWLLAQSECRIREFEARIAKLQKALALWLNAGLDVSIAEETVLALKDTLLLMVDHRLFIQRAPEDERQGYHTLISSVRPFPREQMMAADQDGEFQNPAQDRQKVFFT